MGSPEVPVPIIFCPQCQALVLNAPRCSSCGRWERPAQVQTERGALAWRRAVADTLCSGLVLSDNVLFCVDADGKLHALRARDGQPVWHAPVDLGPWRVHEQVAVAHGLVLIGPTDLSALAPSDKAVLAFDAETGAERWRQLLAVRQISDPLARGDRVFVSTSDGFAAALALDTGRLLWKRPIDGVFLAAPALAGNLVLFGGDRGVVSALDITDGQAVWSFRPAESSEFGQHLPYSPAVMEDTVYVTSWNRRCYALDATSGELRWVSAPTEKRPPLTSPVLTEDAAIFCAHDRYVYCLDRMTGQRRWQLQLAKPSQVAPLLVDGLLYVVTQDGKVHCIDPTNGMPVDAPLLETSAKVEMAWATDGHLIYLGDHDGQVYGLMIQPEVVDVDPAKLAARGEWRAAAAWFAFIGDLLRAADIFAEQLSEPGKAAQLYQSAGSAVRAAPYYELAGDLQHARRLYRDLGDSIKVAVLSEQLEEPRVAAQNYEAAGQWVVAGRLYERVQAWPQAASMYEKAGGASADAGDLSAAQGWWIRAAEAYQAAEQSEKAVQLFKAAGQPQQAEQLIAAVRDPVLWRQLQRALLGSALLGRRLETEEKFVPAAEEYLQAGQPLDAARMYEAAGEYALAIEHYLASGFLLDAARCQARAGSHHAAAELFLQAGDIRQAAQAFALAGNRHQAAQAFEQVDAWPEAAGEWEAQETWERAAAAWEKAGQPASAGAAWEKAGELLHAAESYCQAAEEAEQDTGDKIAAVLYERAMLSYSRCGADRRAAYCDRKRRFLRKQPLLEATVTPAQPLVAGVLSKLVIEVKNTGWGYAENVAAEAAAWFETDPARTHSKPFGLGPGMSKLQDLFVTPHNPGRLALELTMAYQDIQGNDYPVVEQTVDIPVAEKEGSKGVTPAEIHVHGDYFAGEVHEVVSGVKVERRSGSVDIGSKQAQTPVPTIECTRCGHQERADLSKCGQCQAPFAQCRHCGLALPGRMKHCMHCGQPI